MAYDRDAVSPWAFFLPIALAIVVGNLISDAIGHALRDRFDDTPATVVAQVAPPAEIQAPATSPVDVTPPPEPVAVAVQPVTSTPPAPHPDAAVLAEPDSAGAPPGTGATDPGVRRLSGPMTARQAGESESCINFTVATRSPNGWEQALENDAPVRCEATSN